MISQSDRCRIAELEQAVATLTAERNRAENARCWAFDRIKKIQDLQSLAPEPYRTLICNVLANGSFAHDSRLSAAEAIAALSPAQEPEVKGVPTNDS